MNSRQRKAVQSAINAFDKARDWLVEVGDHEGLIEALDATIEDLEEELKMATAINGPSEAQSSGKASERCVDCESRPIASPAIPTAGTSSPPANPKEHERKA